MIETHRFIIFFLLLLSNILVIEIVLRKK